MTQLLTAFALGVRSAMVNLMAGFIIGALFGIVLMALLRVMK